MNALIDAEIARLAAEERRDASLAIKHILLYVLLAFNAILWLSP